MVNAMNERTDMQAPDHNHTPAPQAARDELLSALVDGEVSATDMERLLAGTDDLTLSWSCYHLIGDTLRGSGDRVAAADAVRVAGVMARLAQEGPPRTLAAVPVAPHVPSGAANDPVFRWKMVAGLASLAAVGLLTWQIVSQPSPATGPQLAVAPSTAPVTVAPAANEVVVAGELGPVIRDARLEELMAAHRQLGGVSALQMPAGFLRSATFETPSR